MVFSWLLIGYMGEKKPQNGKIIKQSNQHNTTDISCKQTPSKTEIYLPQKFLEHTDFIELFYFTLKKTLN